MWFTDSETGIRFNRAIGKMLLGKAKHLGCPEGFLIQDSSVHNE